MLQVGCYQPGIKKALNVELLLGRKHEGAEARTAIASLKSVLFA